MKITTAKVQSPPCMVLAIDGKVVGTGATELENALQQVMAEGETRLVLDLTAAPIISSAGLRVIIVTTKRARALPSGDLRLAGLSQQMLDVLELAGLLTVLKVYPSQQAAIESFQTANRSPVASG
ncbi:MAG: STAS domain-containing protein [Anaerolineae bacterium]|nr:STAS domain-containing protein [Anaerolineae bacterium]MCB9129928.1 STAS domain-containing protein [Anaerolineales bacterium]MCO5246225.1 STAS domain-containing protein [Anaerolineae bacterium]